MVHVKLRHVGPGALSFHLAAWLCLARKSSPAVTSTLAQALKSNTRASMPFVQYAFAVGMRTVAWLKGNQDYFLLFF